MTRAERWVAIIVATFAICLLGQIASNTDPNPQVTTCDYAPQGVVTCK